MCIAHLKYNHITNSCTGRTCKLHPEKPLALYPAFILLVYFSLLSFISWLCWLSTSILDFIWENLFVAGFFFMYVSSSLLLLLFYTTTVYYYKVVVAYDWSYLCLSQELTLQTCVLEECLLLLSSSGEHLLIANSCRSKTRKSWGKTFPFLCLSSSTETVKVQRKPQ